MAMKVRFRDKFPASVSVTSPLTLDKSGGHYTFGYSASVQSNITLGSGATISWNSGDVVITEGTNLLDFSGASLGYSFDAKVYPTTNDGGALGDPTHGWSDLFLASGGVINWNAGDVTATHSANGLAFSGASNGYNFDAALLPTTNDGAALGSASVAWSDAYFASGSVINWNAGDVTLTHAANALAFASASNGYSFDAAVKPSANDAAALGAATTAWSDGFFASGAVLNFNNSDATITHSAGILTASASVVITKQSGAALSVGRLSSNPALNVSTNAASSVTGLEITAASAGNSVFLGASSSATNENFQIDAKGTGSIFFGLSSTGDIQFRRNAVPSTSDIAALGTAALQWSDLFLAEGGVLNWDNGDVTMTQTGNSLTVAGGKFVAEGTATNDTASAGQIGEYQESIIGTGSAISLTSATTFNVTTISLTAGDWECSGIVNFLVGGTTNVTSTIGGISTTSATMPLQGNPGFTQNPYPAGGTSLSSNPSSVIPRMRILLSATVTAYLLARANFTVSTMSACGYINARRVR